MLAQGKMPDVLEEGKSDPSVQKRHYPGSYELSSSNNIISFVQSLDEADKYEANRGDRKTTNSQ